MKFLPTKFVANQRYWLWEWKGWSLKRRDGGDQHSQNKCIEHTFETAVDEWNYQERDWVLELSLQLNWRGNRDAVLSLYVMRGLKAKEECSKIKHCSVFLSWQSRKRKRIFREMMFEDELTLSSRLAKRKAHSENKKTAQCKWNNRRGRSIIFGTMTLKKSQRIAVISLISGFNT